MTTPLMDDRAPREREPEMYREHSEVATHSTASSRDKRVMTAGEGAILGIAIWVVLLTLGFPWILHLEGFDGLIPCAILGAFFGWLGWRRVTMGALSALCLAVVVIAFTPIIVGPVRSLVRNDPLPAHADAVMVLSAGVNDDGTISHASMDQLIKGIALVNRGIAPVLVVTREAYIIDGRLVTSQRDQERIVSLTPGGVSRLVSAGVTHSTHDEAVRALTLVRARNWKRIVLVTSPLHTRRACATFEKIGVVVSCTPSNTRGFALGAIGSPTDRVRAFQVWLYELAGTLRYRQLGYI
ncbi:MAG: YdcF family protein [Gemmatimonadaceae bacterium]